MILGIGRLSSPHPVRTLICSGAIAVLNPVSNNNAINVDTSHIAAPNTTDTTTISSNNGLLIFPKGPKGYVEEEIGGWRLEVGDREGGIRGWLCSKGGGGGG